MEADVRTLFIGNIDKNVSEEILYELFLQAGPIDRVSIPNNRNESSKYGFVTYKHECSIEYAIELFKGTNLFKKELSIRKRCPKNTMPGQQPTEYKFGGPDLNLKPGILDFQAQLNTLKLLAQNLNYNSEPLLNFKSNTLRGDRPSQNRSHDFGNKNYFSRPWDVRDRRSERNYSNKMSHGRKNRHRD